MALEYCIITSNASSIITSNTSNASAPVPVAGPPDRERYYEQLREAQRIHLEQVRRNEFWKPCAHDQCPACLGTGIKRTGGACIHMLACSRPKCSVYC